jgi:hypothetical protein
MTNSEKALIVSFPKEIAGMSEPEVRSALQELDSELNALAEKQKTLRQERKLIELVGWVMHPESFAPEYRNIAMTVQGRLRRARELKEGTGQTKNEDYRKVADQVTSKESDIDKTKLSTCCEAGTWEGEQWEDDEGKGNRYCSECGEPCSWKRK